MTFPKLGRLTTISAKAVWLHEAQTFTPLKVGIRQLAAQRQTLEAEIGAPLSWQELPTKKASRIALYRNGVDPADPGTYPDLHAWMLDKMQRFRLAFAPRVKLLNLGADGSGNGESDEDA